MARIAGPGAQLVGITAALLAATGPPLLAQSELVVSVPLTAGPTRLSVEFDSESRLDWAEYMAGGARSFLVAAESYLGSPLEGGKLRVVGGEDVRLDGRWVGGWADVAGRTVFIQYDIAPVHNPSLLYHELGHLWFAENVTDQAWLSEGIASFLPTAMAWSGRAIVGAEAGPAHWGLRHLRYAEDRPTIDDYRNLSQDDFFDWYRKTFKIQYLIHRRLGPAGYRAFLSRLMGAAPVNGSDAVLRLLGEIQPGDWESYLSGWVFPGPYLGFSWGDFADRDHDGALDVDEHFAGSDPLDPDSDGDGLPDGAELSLGSDPLAADAAETRGLPPFVDGNALEWGRFRTQSSIDRQRDSEAEAAFDLVALRYTIQRGALYLVVETRAPPQPVEGVFFDVLGDLDLDGTYDVDFAFWLDHPPGAWHYDGGMVVVPGLQGGMGSVFEIAIPLEELGPGEFQFLPIIRNAAGEFNYDEWDAWIRVNPADWH